MKRNAVLQPSQNTSALHPISTASLRGYVKSEKAGLGLSGIRVAWQASLHSELLGKVTSVTLGEGVSGADGVFDIYLNDDQKSREAFSLLDHSKGTTSHVVVKDAALRADHVEILDFAQTVLITVAAHTSKAPKATKADWALVADFMAVNRFGLTQDLVNQVAQPSRDSPVANWSSSTRLKAMDEISEAAEKLGGISQLSGFIDFEKLGVGDIGGLFEGQLKIPEGQSGSWFPPVLKSETQLYRDYLRGIWVAAARVMHGDKPETNSDDVGQIDLVSQLNNRLFQDFETTDGSPQSAAKLTAAILTKCLTAKTSKGGFGLLANQIPLKANDISDEQYLAALVVLSGVSATELRNRLRVSFDRAAGETTSNIQLNVDALRGFLSDSWQAPQDPFSMPPDIKEKNPRPIVFNPFSGKAPFYLQYEEWRDRRKPFYCENGFDIRRTIPNFTPDYRGRFSDWFKTNLPATALDINAATDDKSFFHELFRTGQGDAAASLWVLWLFAFVDGLNDAINKIDVGEYDAALNLLYQLASDASLHSNAAYERGWYRDEFDWHNLDSNSNTVSYNRPLTLASRSQVSTKSVSGLRALEDFFQPPPLPSSVVIGGYGDAGLTGKMEKSLPEICTVSLHWLFYVQHIFIPFLQSRIASERGDYAGALRLLGPLTGVITGVAERETDLPYVDPDNAYSRDPFYELFRLQSLPYTVGISYSDRTGKPESIYPISIVTQRVVVNRNEKTVAALDALEKGFALAACEWRFLKIFQGNAMLSWAEEVFRKDDPSSIRRARELYKGVLLLHGEDTGTSPHYPKEGAAISPLAPVIRQGNPAIQAQVARARYGLFLIEAGLNAYGWRNDMVPILRYQSLKNASDALASSAKSAQNDFLSYLGHYEQSQLDMMQAVNLLQKSQASIHIAQENIALATVDVDKAKAQVKEVEQAITAKQQEVNDDESFFKQFKDYLSGAKDSITGLLPLAKANANDSSPAASLGSSEITAAISTGFDKGLVKGAATLGSGAAVLGGMAVFVYASYTSMQGMEAAYNKRGSELQQLQTVALPAAKAQVALKERVVSIANYEKQIAEADYAYATGLVQFERERFLGAEMWGRLAGIANQLMRRYVELGARTGWLAERALAFEQNRTVEIIRKNYSPKSIRGLTGADFLQMDLAELENSRIQGVRLTVPIKHTFSLSNDFPLSFGALKVSGRCSILTEEDTLRLFYTGVYGCRIRAVTVRAVSSDGTVFRGIMRNRGVSLVSTADSSSPQPLIRFPDALPISEFRLRDDMQVFGLPGETLLQFEGSGLTTQWDIVISPQADTSLRALTDVIVTIDGFGLYDDTQFALQPPAASGQSGAILFAASLLDPEGLANLRKNVTDQITMDLTKLRLPASASDRKISNLAFICIGSTPADGSVFALSSGETAAITFLDGITASNAPPFAATNNPSPLNAVCGISLNQSLRISFSQSDMTRCQEIAIYLEYSA